MRTCSGMSGRTQLDRPGPDTGLRLRGRARLRDFRRGRSRARITSVAAVGRDAPAFHGFRPIERWFAERQRPRFRRNLQKKGYVPGRDLDLESASRAELSTVGVELWVSAVLLSTGMILIVGGAQHAVWALVAVGAGLFLAASALAWRAIMLWQGSRQYWWNMRATAPHGPRAKRRQTT